VAVFARNNSSYQKSFLGMKTVFFHNTGDGALLCNLKQRFKFRCLATGTNKPDICPASKQKIDRIYDNRLAGAGFAAQNVQSVRKGYLKIIDYRKVSNGEFLKHTNKYKESWSIGPGFGLTLKGSVILQAGQVKSDK